MNQSAFQPPRPQLWKEEVAFLQQTVAALPPHSTIVEIGTAQGGGLHLMAASRQHPASTVIHSFDPYPGDDVPQVCRLHNNVFSHSLFSERGSADWSDLCGNQVDLLVIDGSHTLNAVCNDYDSWRCWLSQRSAVLFHDYDEKNRAGISHPAIKVFCDALLSSVECGFEIQHVGRYLLMGTGGAKVQLEDLRNSALAWINQALQRAGELHTRFARGEIALEGIIEGHSRIRIGQTPDDSFKDAENNDASIVLFLAYEAPSLHEKLIGLLPEPRHVLKWIEYLEMFLHAREWSFAWDDDSRTHPILSAIVNSRSINGLSHFCADIAVLGGMTEAIFSGADRK